MTVDVLIEKAIKQFEMVLNTRLSLEQSKWELYACKQSGRRYSDFPSLDPSQKVEQVGFAYFFLCPRNQITRESSCSSSSSSKIMTEFKIEVKKEVVVKEGKSCLCFRP